VGRLRAGVARDKAGRRGAACLREGAGGARRRAPERAGPVIPESWTSWRRA